MKQVLICSQRAYVFIAQLTTITHMSDKPKDLKISLPVLKKMGFKEFINFYKEILLINFKEVLHIIK